MKRKFYINLIETCYINFYKICYNLTIVLITNSGQGADGKQPEISSQMFNAHDFSK
jgi:hypothetical protein